MPDVAHAGRTVVNEWMYRGLGIAQCESVEKWQHTTRMLYVLAWLWCLTRDPQSRPVQLGRLMGIPGRSLLSNSSAIIQPA